MDQQPYFSTYASQIQVFFMKFLEIVTQVRSDAAVAHPHFDQDQS